MNPNEQQGDLPAWLYSECDKLGITAVWDNRKAAAASDKNPPHVKEAVARGGVGKGKNGDPKAFWPPR
jgi:hypothetical protein